MIIRIPIAGFDIDDVIFQSFKPIQKLFENRYCISISEPPTFSLRDYCSSLTEEQYKNVIDDALANFDEIEPYEGAIEFINHYQKSTHYEVIFVTSRNSKMFDPTFKLLDKWFPNLKYKVFFPHTDGKRKIDVIKKCGIDIFVEDRLKYCLDISSNGCLVLMIDKAWNRRFQENANNNKIVRVNDWSDIRMIYDTFLHLF